MITTVEETMENENQKVNKSVFPNEYGCEILLEKTTLQKSKDSSFPKDAYNVRYIVDNQECLDVCRAGKRVNIFDYYYDKYGSNSLVSIDWGYGKINPKLWGYKAPSDSKRKRK